MNLSDFPKIIRLFIVFFICLAYLSCVHNPANEDCESNEYASPEISLVGVQGDTVEPDSDGIVELELQLRAEAGLNTLHISEYYDPEYSNERPLNAYPGDQTEATYTYSGHIWEDTQIEFILYDDCNNSTSLTVSVDFVQTSSYRLLISPLDGQKISEEVDSIGESESRKIVTFSSHGINNIAEISCVGNNALFEFNSTLENEDTLVNALKIVKTMDSFKGGWSHILLNLLSTIPKEDIIAVLGGSRVIKLDAFYDATVDDDVTWEMVKQANPWNTTQGKGYKVALMLCNYDRHYQHYDSTGVVESYVTYIEKPNEWVTLEFNTVDTGRSDISWTAEPGEVDCIDIRPSPGVEGTLGDSITDENPLYIKNLRIEK